MPDSIPRPAGSGTLAVTGSAPPPEPRIPSRILGNGVVPRQGAAVPRLLMGAAATHPGTPQSARRADQDTRAPCEPARERPCPPCTAARPAIQVPRLRRGPARRVAATAPAPSARSARCNSGGGGRQPPTTARCRGAGMLPRAGCVPRPCAPSGADSRNPAVGLCGPPGRPAIVGGRRHGPRAAPPEGTRLQART
jgi:hypothetical protein